MRYSLNQIEHTVRKAVRGCGFSWGLAEEAGRAVRWLEMTGLDGIELLTRHLPQLDGSEGVGQSMVIGDGCLRRTDGLLSPLAAGPTVGDLLYGVDQGVVQLEQVAAPMLLLGYAGNLAMQTGHSVVVTLAEREILTTAQGLSDCNVIWPKTADMITITKNSNPPTGLSVTNPAVIQAREVDQRTMGLLDQYVHRTYVEATEASRLSGAGAGVSDND